MFKTKLFNYTVDFSPAYNFLVQ